MDGSCSFFYAMIYVVVRGLSDTFEVSQIVFFRAVLGAFFMIPWLLSAGLAALRTAKISLYLWRMIFSYPKLTPSCSLCHYLPF